MFARSWAASHLHLSQIFRLPVPPWLIKVATKPVCLGTQLLSPFRTIPILEMGLPWGKMIPSGFSISTVCNQLAVKRSPGVLDKSLELFCQTPRGVLSPAAR